MTRTSILLDGFWTVDSDLYLLSSSACMYYRAFIDLNLKIWLGIRVYGDRRRVHTHTYTHLLGLVHASSYLDDHQSAPYSPRIIRVCCTHQRSRLVQSP